MSLLSEAMEKCVVMNAIHIPDGRGGFNTALTDGARIEAAITLDTSLAARVADQQGVKNLYTVVTSKNINLQPQTIIKRLSDGKMFKITSDGDDKHTPKSAALDMRVVTAKEYVLGDK